MVSLSRPLVMRLLYFLASSNLWQLALGSLYPTNPTAVTTTSPGTWMNVTWIDKRDLRPHLSEMRSTLKIDLCHTNGTPVATLAKNVSSVSCIHLVQIPNDLNLSTTTDAICPKFVLIFRAVYPMMNIWTADFCINPLTDSVLPYTELDDPNPDLLTLVEPTTTIVTTLARASPVPAVATVVAEQLPADGGAGAGGLNRVHQANSANPRKIKGAQYRDARFRLAFIAWPALVGISIAL
ncbi:hypothetical protein K438DRAFT_1770531 [Mycena galopus ATCC 62051]|nr:hypothetical protein K438DRAFT_1770531 [Mycena galopus ATCC 62051]